MSTTEEILIERIFRIYSDRQDKDTREATLSIMVEVPWIAYLSGARFDESIEAAQECDPAAGLWLVETIQYVEAGG